MTEPDAAETTVYTDGACIGNPGRGGWGWAVSERLYDSGFEQRTTNQRMELTAVIEAVRAFDGRLLIVSDSTYVVNCFRDRWWAGWRARWWLTAGKKPVANQDLWMGLVAEVVDNRPGEIRFRWVKGHSSDRMNNFVDSIANAAARSGSGATSPEPAPRPRTADAGSDAGSNTGSDAGADWEPQRLWP